MAASSFIAKGLPSMHAASETAMRKSGVISRNNGVIDPQLWVDEWRRIHPTKTILNVSNNLHAPVKTVEKWFLSGAAPSLTWFGAILTAYGPAFVVAGMRNPPAWLCDAARAEKRRRLEAERAAIDAEFSDLEYEGLEA